MILLHHILLILFGLTMTLQENLRVDVVRWDLERSTGKLVRMTDGVLEFSDDGGSRESIPLDAVACVWVHGVSNASGDSDVSRTTGSLHLVDGGRLTGRPAFDSKRFTWVNWWTGPIETSLDSVESLSLTGTPPSPGESDVDDVVFLSNGDRISGFIDTITDGVIVLEKIDETTLRMPLENAIRILFANRARPASGPCVWSTRGDRFQVGSIRHENDSGFMINDRPMSDELVSGFVLSSDRVTPLASIPITLREIETTPRFHIPRPIILDGMKPLDASSIELRGPLRAEWSLTRSGMGLVCTVVLPPEARAHGDMRIRILDGDELLGSFELDASNPVEDVSLRVPGRTLRLEILDTGGGPIMDRVRLDHAILISPE